MPGLHYLKKCAVETKIQHKKLNEAYHGDSKDIDSMGYIRRVEEGQDRFSKLYAINLATGLMTDSLNTEILLGSMNIVTKPSFVLKINDVKVLGITKLGSNVR